METPVKILLDRKREGLELPSSDIHDLIASYTKGDVPDYQMAAFAMAVCCKGMSAAEIAKRYAMRTNTVTVSLHRTRGKLRKYLLEEGYL